MKINDFLRIIAVLFFFFVATGCNSGIDATMNKSVKNQFSNAKVKLELELAIKVDSGNRFIAEIEIKNVGQEEIQLYKWHLPEEGNLVNSLFEIERDEKKVRYKGPFISFVDSPGLSALTLLKRNDKRKSIIEISKYYDLSMPGHYRVNYSASSLRSKTMKLATVSSGVVEFDVK